MQPVLQTEAAAPALTMSPPGGDGEVALPDLIADLYGASDPPLRAGLLRCLLGPVRPLALVAIASGAFGRFLHRDPWDRLSVSLDDALRFTSEQVCELARFVEQVQPEVFGQVASLVADDPVGLESLSASLLLTAFRVNAGRH